MTDADNTRADSKPSFTADDANAFNQVLQKATMLRTTIEDTSKAKYKDISRSFAEFAAELATDEFKQSVAEALGLYSGIPGDATAQKRAKKQDAAIRNFFKGAFNKIVDMVAHAEDNWPRENSKSKVQSFVKTLYATLLFMECSEDLKNALDAAGIRVEFVKKPLDYGYGDENTLENAVITGVDSYREAVDGQLEIEEQIYETIPSAMKYDPDANPKGIKKGQFSALANVSMKKQQLESAGEKEKAEELVAKTSEGFFLGSVNQLLLLNAFQAAQ